MIFGRAWLLILLALRFMDYSPEVTAGIWALSWTVPVMVLIQLAQAIFE